MHRELDSGMSWALFAVCLAFFHISEFLLTAIFNRQDLSRRSWLFSRPYCVAMLAACAEHAAELRWAPYLKLSAVSALGLAAVVAGEALRKTAMISAAHNFTHLIQTQRRPQHTLITSGVYSWVRHPGYAGWMLWAVGTQLLLGNPLCTLGFAATSWRFFSRRIVYEDHLLRAFFGAEFERYRRSVPSGIPWVP